MKLLTTVKYGIMAIFIALAFSQVKIIAQEGSGVSRSLEGVWIGSLMPFNCATGEPIPVAHTPVLFTFHKGGTASFWSQNNPITVTRTPFHGLWKREQGYREYSTRFVGLQYNLTTGALSARQESGGTLVLGESGDEFELRSSTTVFFANGNPPIMACSTMVGTRFE